MRHKKRQSQEPALPYGTEVLLNAVTLIDRMSFEIPIGIKHSGRKNACKPLKRFIGPHLSAAQLRRSISMISTSSMSGNSISLDAATRTAMAANKQYMAANAAIMSNILIIVYAPFRSLIQTLDLLPLKTRLSVKAFAAVYLCRLHQQVLLTIDPQSSPVLSSLFSKWINRSYNVL